jgi:hypothetical protein
MDGLGGVWGSKAEAMDSFRIKLGLGDTGPWRVCDCIGAISSLAGMILSVAADV